MFPFHLGFKYLFSLPVWINSSHNELQWLCISLSVVRSAVKTCVNDENVRDLSVDVTTTVTTIATEKNGKRCQSILPIKAL